jgi:hypothetical protein
MHRISAPLLWVAGLLTLACIAASGLGAPAASDTDAKKAETAAEKIKKALDQTVDLEVDQPLHLAVAQLREQTKLNLVLDRQTLLNMGMDPEQTPVSVKLQNVKLRSGLRTLFGQFNLTYAIVGDTLLITSEDMAMLRQLRQRVNLDLDRVQFGTALKQLARDTGTNLLLDSRVHKESQAPVSLQLEDVPLETAVRLMAEMAGLKPVRMGNVLFVTSKASAAELRADPDLSPHAPQVSGIDQLFINPAGVVVPGKIGIGIAPGVPPAAPVPPPPQEDKPARPDDGNPNGGTRPPDRDR